MRPEAAAEKAVADRSSAEKVRQTSWPESARARGEVAKKNSGRAEAQETEEYEKTLSEAAARLRQAQAAYEKKKGAQ